MAGSDTGRKAYRERYMQAVRQKAVFLQLAGRHAILHFPSRDVIKPSLTRTHAASHTAVGRELIIHVRSARMLTSKECEVCDGSIHKKNT
jgi:hypothetical protein